MSAHAAELASPDTETRLRAIAEIAAAPRLVDAEDLGALVACLGFPRKAVQRAAADACAAFGPAARPLLLRALAGADLNLRWGAAFALSRFDAGAIELLPPALEALGSGDGDVRWAAAEIVRRLAGHHPEVDGALLDVVALEPPERRKMVLYCLRDLPPTDRGRAAAVGALDDADEGVALAALAAVTRLAPDEAEAAARVVGLLESPNPRLQRAAASALGFIGRERSEIDDALRRAAASEDESLRRAAEGAINRRFGSTP